MPKPHVHPSVNCYQNHKCRCIKCRQLVVLMREKKKQRAALDKPKPDPLDDAGTRVRSNPLSHDEVVKLRRMVGLPDEGPPPERTGRPRRIREDAR